MRYVAAVLVAGLVATSLAAQQSTYSPVENPYQIEIDFTLGQPIELDVEIDGLRVSSLTLTPSVTPAGQAAVQCDVQVLGASVAERRLTVGTVVLLEDENGKGIERVTLDQFRVKGGRAFEERQRREVSGAALAAARKVYLLIQVSN